MTSGQLHRAPFGRGVGEIFSGGSSPWSRSPGDDEEDDQHQFCLFPEVARSREGPSPKSLDVALTYAILS